MSLLCKSRRCEEEEEIVRVKSVMVYSRRCRDVSFGPDNCNSDKVICRRWMDDSTKLPAGDALACSAIFT